MKVSSVCLSRTRFCYWGTFHTVYSDCRTRFVIGGHFTQYILIAGLQLLIPRAIDISSIVCQRPSIVYHKSFICQFIFILHCHVYVGDWSTVAACWHRTCLALRWGVVTSLLQSVTPADTLHRALFLARGCS